jgi:membrane protein DedA with SNARE-associated domain
MDIASGAWEFFGKLWDADLQELLLLLGPYFYVVTFVWTALEGETFVIFAGWAAHKGLLDIRLLILFAWLGSFTGDQIYFLLGRRYGQRMLTRFPRWKPGVDRALDLLERYNTGFILSFRFIYGVRNFSSFAMGMSPLAWPRYCALNFIAAGVWACAFAGTGYLFGEVLNEMLGDAAWYVTLGFLVLFILVAAFLITGPKRRAKRLAKAAAAATLEQTKAEAQGPRPNTTKPIF